MNSPAPAPEPPESTAAAPDLRWVFVVTYGRSGSTLIQGMLNALPRTLVRGENNFFVFRLFRSWVMVKNLKDRLGGGKKRKTTSAFYGVHELDLVTFAASVRDLVRVQLLGSRSPEGLDWLGFKEVHWDRLEPTEWSDFSTFMDLAFHDPLYVLNGRDVEAAAASGFWQLREPGEARAEITRIRELQDFLRESHPERCYDTSYEVITGGDVDAAAASMRGLAEFVTGSCDDEVLENMLALREVAHGPKAFAKTRED